MAERPRPTGGRWWVEQQHDHFKVTNSETRPEQTVEAGQRLKKIHGPFLSKEAADSFATKHEGRTMRAKHAGRVR